MVIEELTLVEHVAVAGDLESISIPPLGAVKPLAVVVFVAESGFGQLVTPEWQLELVAVKGMLVTDAECPPSRHGVPPQESGRGVTDMSVTVPPGRLSCSHTL